MNEENRFFRFIWRFNGIVLMVAACGVIIALATAGYSWYRGITHREVADVVNVEKSGAVKERLEFGQFTSLIKTPYVMLPLHSSQSYAQSYYLKSTRSTRNILFIDTRTNESHWLFPTNRYLILNDAPVPEGYGDKGLPAKAILYLVTKKDTDGDKRLTPSDKKDIAISLPSGFGYKELVGGVDALAGHQLAENDTVSFVYYKEGDWHAASVHLTDFAVTNETKLPRMNTP
jgi:hypothetical protein